MMILYNHDKENSGEQFCHRNIVSKQTIMYAKCRKDERQRQRLQHTEQLYFQQIVDSISVIYL